MSDDNIASVSHSLRRNFALGAADIKPAHGPARRPSMPLGARSLWPGRVCSLALVCALVASPSPARATTVAALEDAAATEPAQPSAKPMALRPFIVTGTRYHDPFVPMPDIGFAIELALKFSSFSYETSPLIVTPARAPQARQYVFPTARILLADELRTAPTLTVDSALRSVPDFSLFRRSDSFSAHPTAQGVSLRGLGPSGASRSLILLDGVPLNDPFGGWVAWTKIPRDGLARAEVIPGGGATVWGNAALGGVVQLFTRRARGEMMVVREPLPPGSPPTAEGRLVWGTRATLYTRAEIGDYGTRSLEFSAVYPERHGTLQLLGRMFATDGFPLVAPERRGPIDIAAWSRHRWLTARWRQPLGPNTELTATVRSFTEKRGNGTPYQRNGSREKFASIAATGQVGLNFTWDAVAYVQDQSFASTSSSVNASRTAETPASDEFAVPSLSLGAAWTGTWKHDGYNSVNGARSSVGTDVRFVRGETRENFNYVNADFTRQRAAGGRQMLAGLYALHELPLADDWRATAGARVDAWRDADGHRRETDRATATVWRDDRYPVRDDMEYSPNVGLIWRPSKTWRTRATVQEAFRRPTLNELYRPFRIGTDVIEPNPALRTEHVTNFEIGSEWTIRFASSPPPPVPSPTDRSDKAKLKRLAPRVGSGPTVQRSLTLGLAGFSNDLRDAVGDVTIARGPGTFPIVGRIADDEVGRQRLNLERTRVRGIEFSAKWVAAKALTVTAEALYSNATVRNAQLAPALVGNRLAEVPRRSGSIGAMWLAPAKLVFSPRVRYIGRQFGDDENQLTLGAMVIADLAVSRPLNKHLDLFVTVENLGNARIETGRSADGVVNIGTPRLAVAGLRGSW